MTEEAGSEPIRLGGLPRASAAYLAEVERAISELEPEDIAERVVSIVHAHDGWRRDYLSLLASDNVASPGSLRLLDSDLATRVSEGFPGAKDFPPGRVNEFIDELEGIAIALLQSLFRARFVEWRPLTNSMANELAIDALTDVGDAIMVQSLLGGGNMSYQAAGSPSGRRLVVEEIPTSDHFGVDVTAAAALAWRIRPKLFIVGGSKVLFPYPLAELVELARELEARVLFDAAHVGALIAAGMFQDPLAEGVDVMSTGTHKSLGGPVGGVLLTNDPDIAARIRALVYPRFLQTRDANKYAAAAFALAETKAFGAAYARQLVINAKTLAAALEARGLTVLAKERGYTETHQLFVDVSAYDPTAIQDTCQHAGIGLHLTRLPSQSEDEPPSGFRLSVQEPTRRGMTGDEMKEIASLIALATRSTDDGASLQGRVKELMTRHPSIEYSFTNVA
jgi:glycine hydroxymethyltransferase